MTLVKTIFSLRPAMMEVVNVKRLSVLELLTLDASELQSMLSQGIITSVSLAEQVLNQIAREDREGANLRAMLFVRPREMILEDAARLDDERRHGKLRGPFHGIPIIVKDDLTNSPSLGTPSTLGCYALLSSKPRKNSAVVDKVDLAVFDQLPKADRLELIADGLIIIGKSNLNEFSMWKGFNGINGFSAIGGQTNSAYIIGGLRKHEAPMGHTSPCGSSTGSAVGVSAGYSPVAIGTETEGSIIQPAGRAALFALKPTAGSVPREGAWCLAKAIGSTGAMTKSVRDLAIMTAMIHTGEVREKLPATGYTSFLTKTFAGLKVGFADPAIWHFPASLCPQIESVTVQLNTAYFDAMSKIKKGGANVEFPVSLPRPSDLTVDGVNALSIVIFNEYQKNINDYLGSLAFSEVKNLKELIDWNEKHAYIELPFYYADQGILIKALNYKSNATEQEEALNLLRIVSMEKGLDPLFDGQGFDLIALPQDSEICVLPMASGYPAATMPLGTLDHLGRPFSLAVIAKAGREDLIFQFLSAFEITFPKRVVPPQLIRIDDETK